MAPGVDMTLPWGTGNEARAEASAASSTLRAVCDPLDDRALLAWRKRGGGWHADKTVGREDAMHEIAARRLAPEHDLVTERFVRRVGVVEADVGLLARLTVTLT